MDNAHDQVILPQRHNAPETEPVEDIQDDVALSPDVEQGYGFLVILRFSLCCGSLTLNICNSICLSHGCSPVFHVGRIT